jgi:hypothetical protein
MSHHTGVMSRIYWSEAVKAVRDMAMDPRSGEFSCGDADILEQIASDIRRANAHQPRNPTDLERCLEFFKTMGFARPEEGLSNYRPMTVEPQLNPYGDGPPGTRITLDDQHVWYFDAHGRQSFIAEAHQ